MRRAHLVAALRRARRSTVILCALFAAVFVLYLWVRPVPPPSPTSGGTVTRQHKTTTPSPSHRPTHSPTPTHSATHSSTPSGSPTSTHTATTKPTTTSGATSTSPGGSPQPSDAAPTGSLPPSGAGTS